MGKSHYLVSEVDEIRSARPRASHVARQGLTIEQFDERDDLVWALREQGLIYSEIVKQLGLTIGQVRGAKWRVKHRPGNVQQKTEMA